MLAVPLRWPWRLRRQAQLRSTASKEGKGSRGTDLTTTVELEHEELLTKNKSQLVTPLLAQRITLTGNSYFWRTAVVRSGWVFDQLPRKSEVTSLVPGGLIQSRRRVPQGICHAQNGVQFRVGLGRNTLPAHHG